MIIIFSIAISIIFILKAYFSFKFDYSVINSKNSIHKDDYKDLIECLESLSPEQMKNLEKDLEDFVKSKENKIII